jgi:hypothetical protein
MSSAVKNMDPEPTRWSRKNEKTEGIDHIMYFKIYDVVWKLICQPEKMLKKKKKGQSHIITSIKTNYPKNAGRDYHTFNVSY